MSDKELQSQMSELGYANAGFVHGIVNGLYMGNIMRNNCSTPSNLSPFTFFELDPLLTTQTAHYLYLHLLSKNTEGKSMDKIKASQIQEVNVPTTFKELHQTLQFYSGINSILFGSDNALVSGVKSIAAVIKTEKIIMKGLIATADESPTQFLYVMEIQIQHWLGERQKNGDH